MGQEKPYVRRKSGQFKRREKLCDHKEWPLTNFVPLILLFLFSYLCGGANLRLPTGGFANGIPR
jgi:hypothetical protein